MPPKASKGGKRPGRPLKMFPAISELSNYNPPTDLDTLANAAENEGINFDKLWPKLDVARQRLDDIRSHKSPRGRHLSKDNRTELANAVNSYHAVLLNPLSILDKTPDLHKDEFKFQAILLARDYLQFCVDVTPKQDSGEKLQFLKMQEEKIIQPIREQPHLWGKWSAQIADAAKNWERVYTSALTVALPKPTPPPEQPVPPKLMDASDSTAQRTLAIAPRQQIAPFQNVPPSQLYQSPYGGYQYAATSSRDPFGRSLAPPHYGQLQSSNQYRPIFTTPTFMDPSRGPLEYSAATNPAAYAATYLPTPPREMKPSPIPPTDQTVNQTLNQTSAVPRVYLPFEEQQTSASPELLETTEPPERTPTPPTLRPEKHPRAADQVMEAIQTHAPPTTKSIHQRRRRSSKGLPDLETVFKPTTRHITRHPSYIAREDEQPEDETSSGKSEDEDSDGLLPLLLNIPKRPKSAGMEEAPESKRIKLEVELHRSHTVAPEMSTLADAMTIDRPKTRQEVYEEVAQQQAEDVRVMSDIQEGPDTPDSSKTALIPVLREAGGPLPARRPLSRSRSRADIALEETLTPSFGTMMSPAPREGSPDRQNWGTAITTSPIPRRPASNIVAKISSKVQSSAVLPPGWNALGAKSPETFPPPNTSPVALRGDQSMQNLNHLGTIPFVAASPFRQLSLPTDVQITAMMTQHDQYNKSLTPVDRQYYIYKRTQLIAHGSNKSKVYNDGMIKLGRFFVLTEEEVDEVQRYLQFITGNGDSGPKTMVRLVCRPRGVGSGRKAHLWPENTIVMVNGKAILITPDTPLYLAKEDLRAINNIRVKIYPQSIHGRITVNLEVFSLLSYNEMKRYLICTSPKPTAALERYLRMDIFHGEDNKAHLPLRCGGQCPHMITPVYGKNCTHVKRIELSCFVQHISVGPLFQWTCPICNVNCGDEMPLVVDTLLTGILKALPAGHHKENVQIMADGQICDDESDPEDDGDVPESDEDVEDDGEFQSE